eukprot:CAMPEP_0202894900 /NCGR_PEP_ID=MMETSP1392-20130828/4198_1 /ASSEMBLY_ACC=CAM_ASM_000868 /TAXON_ID=225041 /ORGANISM="Chlamydomonas chlamydogama, Strain SAG 11-48b" /LENGTH=145 /DNA_ID=CAMNT_0049579737 /DNA_START=97 /DNA_END=534 /DNA_ORIENTATION=-
MKQTAPLQEVSASSTPKEVVGAIVSSAVSQPKAAPNPNRWFQFALAFVIIFALVVYFREEIYTVTKDVRKHPILAGIESLQIHQYLGSNWVFGEGKDIQKIEGLPDSLPTNVQGPANGATLGLNTTARAAANVTGRLLARAVRHA